MKRQKEKMPSAYETMILLGEIKDMDWELEKEKLVAVAKFKKIQFDGFIKAGFTEAQALELCK